MKRWAIRILVFLLLGAIVNVAVAWGCARWVTIDWRLTPGTKYDHFTNWGIHDLQAHPRPFVGYTASRWSRTGAMRVAVGYSLWQSGMPGASTIEFEDILPAWALGFFDIPELVGRERQFLDDVALYSSLVDARGWPCLSLWGGMKLPSGGTWMIDGQPVTLVARKHWIVPLHPKSAPTALTDYRWLPLRPIWPGFAINTVFYAAILWLLFAAPFALRRQRRLKRGLCVKCAYDLRGSVSESTACPECGAARI